MSQHRALRGCPRVAPRALPFFGDEAVIARVVEAAESHRKDVRYVQPLAGLGRRHEDGPRGVGGQPLERVLLHVASQVRVEAQILHKGRRRNTAHRRSKSARGEVTRSTEYGHLALVCTHVYGGGTTVGRTNFNVNENTDKSGCESHMLFFSTSKFPRSPDDWGLLGDSLSKLPGPWASFFLVLYYNTTMPTASYTAMAEANTKRRAVTRSVQKPTKRKQTTPKRRSSAATSKRRSSTARAPPSYRPPGKLLTAAQTKLMNHAAKVLQKRRRKEYKGGMRGTTSDDIKKILKQSMLVKLDPACGNRQWERLMTLYGQVEGTLDLGLVGTLKWEEKTNGDGIIFKLTNTTQDGGVSLKEKNSSLSLEGKTSSLHRYYPWSTYSSDSKPLEFKLEVRLTATKKLQRKRCTCTST